MKRTYLILSIVGFIIPNILVFQESIESGNILLWLHPMDTFVDMFANRIASIFAIDLFLAVFVFFIWSFSETKKHGIRNLYLTWLLTMFFGLAGAFPLFLYFREEALSR